MRMTVVDVEGKVWLKPDTPIRRALIRRVTAGGASGRFQLRKDSALTSRTTALVELRKWSSLTVALMSWNGILFTTSRYSCPSARRVAVTVKPR
jgi:acyl-CoA synthetase (AMP-forming)/AMP-acid ligase II